MSGQTRNALIAVLVVLVGVQAFLQVKADPTWRKNYAPKSKGIVAGGLSPEQLLVALGGMREFVAGILWVRADGFFHTGNYDAILPMVRIVTWLNPHQRDVYSTGAWHMAYNFTDEQQRSDRRYISPALTLLHEGVENNPTSYELFFETGWMYSNKIEDHFDKAVYWFNEAWKRPDILDARRNMLAHAYERNGQLDDAINVWYDVLDRDQKLLDAKPEDWILQTNRDVAENNLDVMIQRMVARKYDTKPPIDLKFGVQMRVVEPKLIDVRGWMGINTMGARIRMIIKDAGYSLPDPAREFAFDVPKDTTYLQDSLYDKFGVFKRQVDMSKDLSMYSFKKDAYDVEFYWNPRLAGPHIQDRTGYNGEGISDKHYVRDGYELSGLPRQKASDVWNVVYCKGPYEVNGKLVKTISRDMLLRKGEWADKIPVITTPGFKPPPDTP